MKTKTLLKNFGTSLLGAILCFSTLDSAQAQVLLSGTYTENFDNLISSGSGVWSNNSTVPGWYASSATITADDGSIATPNGLYSFGSNNDRALGGAFTLSAPYYGLRLKNTTGSHIQSFTINYTVELWRKPSGNTDQVVNFAYSLKPGVFSNLSDPSFSSVSAGNISWKPGGGGNGKINGNSTKTTKSFSFNISLNDGEEILLRWQDASTSGYHIALDDIQIIPQLSPSANVYYSKASGNLDARGTWGTSQNGSGTQPPATNPFDNATFVIANRINVKSVCPANWTLNANSRVLVETGTFEIPTGVSLNNAKVDVVNNAILKIDGVVPTLGSLGNNSTVIYNGSGVQDVLGKTYGNLTISNSGTKILNAKATVNGILNFSGSDLLASSLTDTLFLGTNATVSETSAHYFKGRMVKPVTISSAVTTPVDFGGMGITFHNTNNGNWGTVKVTRTTNAAIINPKDNTKESIKRSWHIQPQNQAGTNVNLKFNWLISEDNGQNYGTTNLQGQPWKSTDNGSTWIPVGNLVDIQTNGDVRTASVTTNSFSIWTMSGPNNPLPVSWLSFNGKATEKGNMLTWSTASEKNSESFIVERSVNGKTFEAIGTVKAAGNSNQVLTYNFTDKQPFTTATAYYRLKQTDTDGAFEYSTLVAIAKNDRMAKVVSVYPNPFGQTLNLQLAEGHAAKKVVLLSLEGKEVYSKNLKSSPETTLNDLPNLKAGVYFLKLIGENETTTLKVMRQ